MTNRWWARLLASVGAVFTLAIGIAPSFPAVTSSKDYAVILLGFGGASVFCQFVSYLVRDVSRRQSIGKFLEHVHKRSWGENGGKNRDYRVSLWVPGRLPSWKFWRKQRLICFYRTDGRRTKKSWSMHPPPHGPGDTRDGHGLVGTIWLSEMSLSVAGLPDRASEADCERYRHETCVTKEEHDLLTWNRAGMAGTIVRFSPVGEAIGVLVVECRSGSAIDPKHILQDPDIFAMIWEGRL